MSNTESDPAKQPESVAANKIIQPPADYFCPTENSAWENDEGDEDDGDWIIFDALQATINRIPRSANETIMALMHCIGLVHGKAGWGSSPERIKLMHAMIDTAIWVGCREEYRRQHENVVDIESARLLRSRRGAQP